jgi:hypothetical protein
MVEVGENDENSSALFTKRVADRDLNIVKGDVGSSSSSGVTGLDLTSFNALSSLDENHSEAAIGLTANSEVVGEGAVCDPLLGS